MCVELAGLVKSDHLLPALVSEDSKLGAAR